MADLKPGRGSDQFPLRLPDGMRERIREESEKSGRSMNAEIVQRLTDSLDRSPNQLRVSIPDELASSLATFASANKISMEEFVIRALRTEMLYDARNEPELGSAKYIWVELQRTLIDLTELQGKLTQAEKDRDEARARLGHDHSEAAQLERLLARKEKEIQLLETNRNFETLLLFSQLLSYNTFVRQVIDKGEAIPDDLCELAKRHLKTTEKVIADMDAAAILDPEKKAGA